MSDHERGAYTPQPDAPLSFDVRVARERKPLPLALIASCVILSTLVVVAFMLYRSGVRSQNEPPRPVGEPIAAIKAAPPAADAGNATAAAPGAGQPAFAPEPEQPMARPAPGQQAAAQPAQLTVQQTQQQPPAISAPAQPAPAPVQAQQAPPKPAPAPAPVVKQAVAAPRPAPVAAKPAPVVAKAAPAPKAAAAAIEGDPPLKAGSIVVQIGAFTTPDLAKGGWQRVAGLVGGAINGKGRHIEPVDAGGATRYRSQVTGFATHADAVAFCTALKAKGHDCLVKALN